MVFSLCHFPAFDRAVGTRSTFFFTIRKKKHRLEGEGDYHRFIVRQAAGPSERSESEQSRGQGTAARPLRHGCVRREVALSPRSPGLPALQEVLEI